MKNAELNRTGLFFILIRIMGNNKAEAAVTSRSRQNYVQINYRIIILQTDSQDCTVHLHTIESFIYPTDAQLDCSKNVKIYMRGAPTCFSFSHPSSGSYYMCFAKVISINIQLKYVNYRIRSV
jgi:hypothetical protein